MPGAFEIENGVLKKYHGDAVHVVIPDGVTEIGMRAFCKSESLVSVSIPEGVTAIGKDAFWDCTSLASVVIPETVTAIGEGAFSYCTSLVSVAIPESVVEIEKDAFSGCSSLASVTIPSGVKAIWWSTFSHCPSLASVDIPDGMRAIEIAAFAECHSLTSIVIPDSVTEIGKAAFRDCPATVVCSEGSYAHRHCEKNRITFVFDYQYEAFNGVLPQGYEKLASPFLADEEGPYVFVSYSHRDRNEVLPIIEGLYEDGWRIWYDEGLTIGDSYDETLEEHVRNCSAFLLFVTACSRESAYIRDNEVPWATAFGRPVVECVLDGGAGYGVRDAVASVSSLDIGRALEGVEGLAKGERRVAKGISVVVDPATREEGAGGGFAYCLYSAGGAAIARAVMLEARRAGCALYDAAEEGMDLERLRRCACLVTFLDRAFLRDVSLAWTLARKYLAGEDVAICALEDVEDVDLPWRLVGLDKQQWLDFAHGVSADMCTKLARHLQARGCRDVAVLPGFEYEETDRGIVITRYTGMDPNPRIDATYGGVPVVRIDDRAFEGCVRLEKVVIPDGVTEIGGRAFYGCLSLVSVTIPVGVTEIEERAFYGCTSLASIVIPDGVTAIGQEAFYGCTGLASAALPDGLTAIGKEAFYGCTSLLCVVIPESVVEIGGDAFEECRSLASVVIPDAVTEIGHGVFENCSSLPSVDIPDGVTVIGDWAFSGCKSLPSVTIPEGVVEIGASAFSSCWSLVSVDIPKSVREIGPWVFHSCKSLTSVTIPDGVEKIRAQSFGYCTSLVSVAIPDSVTEIGESSFQGCSSLSSLVIPDSVTAIEKEAFDACESLTVTCSEGSYAWRYCKDHGIPVKLSQ